MAKNAAGKLAITDVALHPAVVFVGETRPGPAEIEMMHHESHEQCFIANSVTTVVRWQS
jgi:organic hydroperoxide reductase OsmC/OhrA